VTYQFKRHFTLAEATALLPILRETFERIQTLVRTRTEPHENEGPPRTAEMDGHVNGNGNGNGKSHKVPPPKPPDQLSLQERASTVKDMLVSIQRAGIVVQDPMRGLIDFPAIYNGREVFLCYELADGDRISFFHEIEAGYAGRQPLDTDLLQ